MRRFDFPTAPVVVGMILGPLAEAQMRNALSIGEGRWTIFLQRPGSLALLLVIVAVLVLPQLPEAAPARRPRPSATGRHQRGAPASRARCFESLELGRASGVAAVGQPPMCRIAIAGQRGDATRAGR